MMDDLSERGIELSKLNGRGVQEMLGPFAKGKPYNRTEAHLSVLLTQVSCNAALLSEVIRLLQMIERRLADMSAPEIPAPEHKPGD